MTCWRTHGLVLRSELPLAELPEADGEPEVEIARGGAGHGVEDPWWEGALFQARPDEYFLHVPGVARYRASGGKVLRVDLEGPERDARMLLYGGPLAALLHQRGRTVLEANAVLRDGRALLILGDSGAGKSCLSAALQRAGCLPLADGLCVLEGDPPRVLPGPPFLGLWAAEAEEAGVKREDRRFRPGLEKYVLPLHDPGPAPVPVAAVLEVAAPLEEGFELRPAAGPGRARMLLLRQWGRGLVRGPEEAARRLGALVRLAQGVPSWRLERRRGPFPAALLVERILQEVSW